MQTTLWLSKASRTRALRFGYFVVKGQEKA